MSDFITKDGGKRQVFALGSRRDSDDGKGNPSQIPTVMLRRLAALYQRGAIKYGNNNWRQGQPVQRVLDSLQRHTWDVQDKAVDEDHLAAIIWNATCIMWTLEAIEAGNLPPELDDRLGPLEVPQEVDRPDDHLVTGENT